MIAFDPRDTLAAVVTQGRHDAGEQDVDVGCWIGPDVPTLLVGDEERLRRALHLLVGHAVAATRRGKVSVGARLESREGDQVRLRFEVSDGGPGLVSGRRTDRVGARAVPAADGHMDLVLWKQVVQHLAEELGVKSGVESGNTIWFSVAFAARPQDKPARATPGARNAADYRVLVVEDNLVNQKVATRMIEKLGYSVEVVADGRAAVEALEKQAYDLVLMDCQMPVMDGYEATMEIRRREGDRRHTPIVALTAHAVASNRRRCLEIGMDDFVTKPVTTDQLRKVLDQWLVTTPRSDG